MDTWAVIKTGGKQYKVAEGETISVEKLKAPKNGEILFEVLAVKNDKGVHLGAPLLKKATVQAKFIEDFRDKKIRVVKYKPKSKYLRTTGHRQDKSRVTIETISL